MINRKPLGSTIAQKNKNKVISKEQVIVEDEESQYQGAEKNHDVKISNQSPAQSEGQMPRASDPNMIIYNLDINEQLLEQDQKQMVAHTEVVSVANKTGGGFTPMEVYSKIQADENV